VRLVIGLRYNISTLFDTSTGRQRCRRTIRSTVVEVDLRQGGIRSWDQYGVLISLTCTRAVEMAEVRHCMHSRRACCVRYGVCRICAGRGEVWSEEGFEEATRNIAELVIVV